MENIILLMLFTYPGTIALLLYEQMTKGKTYYHETDTFGKTALCFFISCGITVFSCWTIAYSLGTFGIDKLIKTLRTTPALWQYLVLSLSYSVAAGILWHFTERLRFYLFNRHRSNTHLSPYSSNPKVWGQLVKEYDLTDCAAIIRRNGKVVRAGMPEILPDDINSDRQIVLSYCDRVEAELEKDDRGLLGERFVSVYDLSSDTEIEFIASHALDEAIREEAR